MMRMQCLRTVGCAVAMTGFAVLCAESVHAGEFFEAGGAAVRGYDVVAYVAEGKPVKGSAAYKAEYKGSTFHFSSAANRDAFAADPAKFAPQYGGFCAFGVAGGYKAAIDPAAFTVTAGRLYLNHSLGVQRQWSADIPGFIGKADRNWPAVMGQTKVIQ